MGDLSPNHCVQILTLQSAVEEFQLSEKQLKHKLEVQAETLSSKMEELRALSENTQSSMTTEMMEVQLKTMELESAKVRLGEARLDSGARVLLVDGLLLVQVELEQILQESRYREQQLELSNSRLQRQVERLTEEKEEREREAVSWFNSLEKSRELNRDLQIQLDQVLQQAQDPNSRGNSLFAELEDKRAAMERQLISMKVQHQSLQKMHTFSKQQMQRMKVECETEDSWVELLVQIATLMQLQGSRADPAQLERLQSMLSEKNAEIQSLMTKLQRLEKMETLLKSQPANPVQAESVGGQDETYYTDLLQLKLNNSVKDAERLGDELSLQRMKSLSESQRALELERKLFTSERLLKQTQSDKIKLQLRVEELQQKYEPKEVKKYPIQRKRKEKLPVDVKPEPDGSAHREQVVAVEIEETDHMKVGCEDENSPAEITAAAPASEPEPELKPAKCVKISSDQPDVIPSPSWPVTDQKEETKNNQEVRRKKPKTEVIYVTSNNTMENQCTQQ
ncbi:hypothetical protein CCH79_00016671 [Gambusia affinis]|uniref:Protein Spindly n=1 Tax=Gambusia affinis TaxID=33528 RepID=A0A315W9Q9_GAMAF|nr:hypothetical protein CCH79_00016671 [Gambusia affinis]